MLKHRVLAAVLGIPLILFLTYRGGHLFFAFVFLLTLVSLREYTLMVREEGFTMPRWVPLAMGLALLWVQYAAPHFFAFAIILIFLILSSLSVFYFPRLAPWEIMTAAWGIIYIAGCFSFLLLLRALDDGFLLTLLLFIGIWANDSGAYFVGSSLGRRKLAPLVSPKKTVEGAVGGTLATLVFLVAFALIFQVSLPLAAASALLLSLAGYMGDLVISALKRYYRIKDMGTIIPGHGGFLDRFDSLLFAVPLLYMMLVTFFKAVVL